MPHEPIRRRYLRFFRADPRRDVDEELAFHIAMRAEEYQAEGMSAAEAETLAVQRFGNVDSVRAECGTLSNERFARRERLHRWDALRQDIRYAFRTLAANPAYAAAVVLTVALGIGANSAVFSVAYGVLLRPLPYRDADALVRLWSRRVQRNLDYFSISPADYKAWRAQAVSFSAFGAFERQHEGTLGRPGSMLTVDVTAVTPDVFSLLGTPAMIGRPLTADDARSGAPAVAVLAYDAWASRFGADSSLVGRALIVDGQPHTLVGIMPPRFLVPGTSAEVWTPLSLEMASTDHSNRYLRVLARLRPGIDAARGLRELNQIAIRLEREFPATNTGWSVNAMAVTEMIVGRSFRRSVLVLLGVVGVVLLIACANAANLALARASARRREISVRAALGASRGRVAAQLLTESTVLGVAGSVLGLALAAGALEVLRAYGTRIVPRLEDVRLDAPVLLFTAFAAMATSLLFGVLPALRAARTDVAQTLKEGTRSSANADRTRSLLVVAELAFSLMLLVGAGLLLRSFARLQDVQLGFDPRGLAVASVRAPESAAESPAAIEAFIATLVERAGALPGIGAAATVNSAPFAGPNPGLPFSRTDRVVDASALSDADYRIVTPGYMRTMGIPIVRGRDFAPSDRAGEPDVGIISETMARRYWPGEDPVGRRIRIGDPVRGREVTIVGVVGDVRYQSLETPETRPMIYFSAFSRPAPALQLVVRGNGRGEPAPAIRALMASLAPARPVPTLQAMPDLVNEATATRRFALLLFGIFAGAAMLLAVVGVYGVMAYLVRQRTQEMGIRIALGAPREAVLGLVVSKALRLALAGVAVGLVGAWVLSRLMESLLFGVSKHDPLTFGLVAALLVLASAIASWIPARRATRTDPLVALRGG